MAKRSGDPGRLPPPDGCRGCAVAMTLMFGIGALLLGALVLAGVYRVFVWFSPVLKEWREQRATVREIESMGGRAVYYEGCALEVELPHLDSEKIDRLAEFDIVWLDLGAYGERNVLQDGDLAKLSCIKTLSTLTLQNIDFTATGLQHLRRTRLSVLDIIGGNLDDDSLRAIGTFKQLKFLYFSNVTVRDDELRHLGGLENLFQLSFENAQVRGPGLRHLVNLHKLTELSLARCPLDGTGLDSLAQLPSLNTLGLANTPVDDNTVEYLERIEGLHNLDINDTNITPAGVERLLDHLSGVTIRYGNNTYKREGGSSDVPEESTRRNDADETDLP